MENYKQWTDEKLKAEYKLIKEHCKRVFDDVNKYPDDEFLKNQLKISREYRKKLQIELELRGITNE